MNPKKCVFGVSSSKLLGFIVSQRGIEIDPNKAKAIVEMPPPKSLKEVRVLIGRLQFVRRFISQHSQKCRPLYELLKGGAKFEWNENCQKAFDELKTYLASPPVLSLPVPGKPLLLYMSVIDDSIGAILAQHDDEGKERAAYYLSRLFNDAEKKYNTMEKTCAALVWVAQKLKHYFLIHEIKLIARMNPIKFQLKKVVLTDRHARWQSFLSQFNITYIPQKAVKGYAIAEHLAHLPLPIYDTADAEFPDEDLMTIQHCPEPIWSLYFDGALNTKGRGIGTVLLSPEGVAIPSAVQLNFPATNNVAEYEALLLGFKQALMLGAKQLKVIGDSQVVMRQTLKKYQTKHPNLLPYVKLVRLAAKQFKKVVFIHVPRSHNVLADALASLASSLDFPLDSYSETISVRKVETPATQDLWFDQLRSKQEQKDQAQNKPPTHEISIAELEEELQDDLPWYYDIENYVRNQTYPEEATVEDRKAIRRMANHYTIVGDVLCRRGTDGSVLICVDDAEAWKIVEAAHSSACGGHVNAQMLAKKILRLEYYWPTMEEDCAIFVRRCINCQIHADKIHAPASSLHPMTSPWPFSMWAFDVVGPLGDGNVETKRKSFILKATKYFTKWAEAEAFAEIKASTVVKFVMCNSIARFGVRKDIVTDNGLQFISQELRELCNRYGIHLHHSSPYYPQGNGQAEATNKTLIKIIKKTCETHRHSDWPEKLVEALWAYRSSVRTPTGQTPYSLRFGMEPVLPYEILIPSLRIQLD